MEYRITFFEAPNYTGSSSIADIDRKCRGKHLWSNTEMIVPRVGEFFNYTAKVNGEWKTAMFEVVGVVYQHGTRSGGVWDDGQYDCIEGAHVYLNRL